MGMSMRRELARTYGYIGRLLLFVIAVTAPSLGAAALVLLFERPAWVFWVLSLLVAIAWIPVPLVWFLRWQDHVEARERGAE
jgi:hypothetical protein